MSVPLWVGRSIPHQRGRLLYPSLWHRGYLPIHSPYFVWPCLPWPSSVIGCIPLWVHYPPMSMGIDIIPSTLHTCSFWSLQPNNFTCGVHPSLVDAPVDIHGRSCNIPFFHPREALLVGHCSMLSFLTPVQVVLHGVGLVHLYHVWWLPIHRGKPISDAMRRSWFWWGLITIHAGLSLCKRGHQPWFNAPPPKSLLPTYPWYSLSLPGIYLH